MKNLKGFRIAVLATDGFEQPELTKPVNFLKDAQASVQIIAPKSGEIQGFHHHDKGERVAVDKALEAARSEDYDGLLLPGGALNADALRGVPEAQRFVTEIDRAQKPIAFICHAAWLLVSSKLVKGRTLTSYHSIQDDIRNAGGVWLDEEVVRDRNWVSSRQPADIPAFNKATLEAFVERHSSAK